MMQVICIQIFNFSMLPCEEQQKIMSSLLKRKENMYCAECNSKSPCWASLQFGVFICLNCSGAHRALGPSVTRVKSTRLDTWNRQWLASMQFGNQTLNTYWEYQLSESNRHAKPNENSSVDSIIKFVKDKYIRQLYINTKECLETIKKKSLESNNKKQNEQREKSKVVPLRANSLRKVETICGNVPSSKQIKKVEADFSFFDEMVVKPKQGHDLMNMQPQKQQPPTKVKKPQANLFDFDFAPVQAGKPKQQKFNKQQFMSMGGISANKPKPNINFDNFHHQEQKKNVAHHNLLSFENNENQNAQSSKGVKFDDFAKLQNGPVGQPQYNKSNFASMGGGIHPAHQIHQNYKGNMMQVPKKGMYAFQTNWLGKEGLSLKTPQQGQSAIHKINIEPTINMDYLIRDGVKLETTKKSWADDWK